MNQFINRENRRAVNDPAKFPAGPSPAHAAPFTERLDGFPAGGFFYNNFHIQEALTTVRFGIEARKGLVLLRGAAGVGKTTLLEQLNAVLAANVVRVMAADPRLNFSDILALLLRNLDAANAFGDTAAMIQSCKRCLGLRLQQRQIVALLLDNAQHLSNSTLAQLSDNFLSAPTHSGFVLQIVLVGRPQLDEKLRQAARLSAPLTAPIAGELQPLANGEIPLYIEQGLGAGGLPEDLFEPLAVKQIVRYSQGIPGRINALCDRALRLAGGAGASVSADLIEMAAWDLELRSDNGMGNPPPRPLDDPRVRENNAPEFHLGERPTTAVVGETFLEYSRSYDEDLPPRRRSSTWLTIIAFVGGLVGAGVWLQSGLSTNPLAQWQDQLSAIVAVPPRSAGESKPAPLADPLSSANTETPKADRNDAPAAAKGPVTEPSALAPSEATLEPSRPPPIEAPLPSKAQPPPSRPANPAQARPAPQAKFTPRKEEIQAKVDQAIADRAIIGVRVSVIDGVVYLDGRVATENQHRLAERAARSVRGVERLRNRLTIVE